MSVGPAVAACLTALLPIVTLSSLAMTSKRFVAIERFLRPTVTLFESIVIHMAVSRASTCLERVVSMLSCLRTGLYIYIEPALRFALVVIAVRAYKSRNYTSGPSYQPSGFHSL